VESVGKKLSLHSLALPCLFKTHLSFFPFFLSLGSFLSFSFLFSYPLFRVLWICHCGNWAKVELLLSRPETQVNRGEICTPLNLAVEKGHANVVKMLLRHPKTDFNATKTGV
jgi:hypothetical protein